MAGVYHFFSPARAHIDAINSPVVYASSSPRDTSGPGSMTTCSTIGTTGDDSNH